MFAFVISKTGIDFGVLLSVCLSVCSFVARINALIQYVLVLVSCPKTEKSCVFPSLFSLLFFDVRQVSWRNRLLVGTDWVKTKVFGRDITRL